MGVFAFRRKKQDSPFQPKVEIPFPVVAGEVEYITIEAKHRGRGRCFHRAINFLDCLGKRIFYGGHSWGTVNCQSAVLLVLRVQTSRNGLNLGIVSFL